MNKSRSGFTIVELLIVIVVIGILAAITIVAYNGIQNKANDTAVKNDIVSMAKSFGLYYAERGKYPVTASDLDAMKTDGNYPIKPTRGVYNLVSNNLIYCRAGDGMKYALVARSKSGVTYLVSSDSSSPSIFGGNIVDSQVNVCPAAGMETAGYWGFANGYWSSSWVS